MAVVEGVRATREVRDVLDRCARFRPRSRLFHQPVLLSELCDSIQFSGEVVADG